jgi:hypothetical protein
MWQFWEKLSTGLFSPPTHTHTLPPAPPIIICSLLFKVSWFSFLSASVFSQHLLHDRFPLCPWFIPRVQQVRPSVRPSVCLSVCLMLPLPAAETQRDHQSHFSSCTWHVFNRHALRGHSDTQIAWRSNTHTHKTRMYKLISVLSTYTMCSKQKIAQDNISRHHEKQLSIQTTLVLVFVCYSKTHKVIMS